MSKVDAYRAGLYSIPVPPVTTMLWKEQDWIKFVDVCGTWSVEIVA